MVKPIYKNKMPKKKAQKIYTKNKNFIRKANVFYRLTQSNYKKIKTNKIFFLLRKLE